MSQNNAVFTVDRPYLDFQPDDGWTARPKALPSIPRAAEMLPAVARRGVKVGAVLACAAVAYDVASSDLLAKDRHRTVAEARGVACWLLRSINGLSYPEIGKAIERDHTSVMSAVRKVLRRREEEPGFERFTDALVVAVIARNGSVSE